jgi:Tfp pilus assembly protein PilV
MVELNSKFKASTLMESLIAMVIMVVCLGIATMIYTNVLDSDKQRNSLKALLIINAEAIKVKAEKNYLDDEKQAGDWTIKRTVEKYDQTDNLYKLTFSIFDKDKKVIAVQHELIAVE